MIVQWSVESGRGHFVVGTEPFELGTEAVGAVFRLVPEAAGLLWCDLQLMLERLWQLVKIRFANKQKQKLQLLKASRFTLLTQLVKWEKTFF